MDQLFEKFGLHLNLLIAQILNFGILFFVLYKLAYKPILKILDDRRDKIEASLKQAKEIEEKNRKLEQDIAAQLAEAKQEAENIVSEAKEVGEKARNEILIRTNKEVSTMLEKTKADIQAEKDRMMSDIKDYILKTSFLVIEKILRDRLDQSTKEQLVMDALQELPK